MFINVEKMSMEVDRLNSIIDKYDSLSLELSKKISESSTYWNSKTSISFYSNTSFEKNKNDLFIVELRNFSEIYSYLIKKYSDFGNKIYYDLSMEDNILHLINRLIERYDFILKKFELLDDKYLNEMNQIVKCKNNLLELRKSILNINKKFVEINEEVNRRISNFEIEYVKETDILQFI